METNPNVTTVDGIANQCKGFTRVDLLVIIGLLALLATIQVSAHAGARWRTREAMCASNVRQLTLALHVYGGDNDNKLPVLSGGASWPWDLPSNVGDTMLSYGLHKREFYCPSTAPRYTDWENFLDPAPLHNLWDWGSDFHITGYVFALWGAGSSLNFTNQNRTLLAETIKSGAFAFSPFLPPQANSERVLVADVIISPSGQNDPSLRLSGNYNYSDIAGGYYTRKTSAHLNGGIPEGSNIGFKDGHVAWRKFSDPLVVPRTAKSPWFWW